MVKAVCLVRDYNISLEPHIGVRSIGKLHIDMCGTKYSRMDQAKFFKGCLPQILLDPFLNTLTHVW